MDKITRKDWKYIFFDADDTLWDNEEHFREAKAKFAEKLSSYADKDDILDRLREKQEINFPVWGYGAKTLLIGMMDTAVEICGGQTAGMLYQEIKKSSTNLPTTGSASSMESKMYWNSSAADTCSV